MSDTNATAANSPLTAADGNDVDNALSRWRESCIFFFKFDIALAVAVAASISFFKLDSWNLLEQAAQYKPALEAIGFLLVYALAFEYFITTARNSKDVKIWSRDERKETWILRIFSCLYTVQVLGHVTLVILSIGYASGMVDGYMQLAHPLK